MTKTRVLHLTFDMSIGGAQQVIRQLVENMDNTLISSEILCIDNRLGELGEMMSAQGVNIHLLNRQHGFDYKLVYQINKLIRERNIHVLHCHQYTPYVYGLLASIVSGAKVIFTEHGRFYPDYSSWKRKLINPVFNLFTYKVTAISRATKKALVKYENFNEKDIDVIYNGVLDVSQIVVDEELLKKQLGIPEDRFILGTISRLQPIKNQKMMIRAFSRVHGIVPCSHLLVVGDGEIRNELEELVSMLKVSDYVTFVGFQKEAYRFHKIIDLFLLSSLSEGTSMTILEAMSFSKPCVVTDVGGNPELIKDGENGYVVPSDDEEAFANACTKLIENQQLRKKMSVKGREKYLELFNVNSMANNFSILYQDVS